MDIRGVTDELRNRLADGLVRLAQRVAVNEGEREARERGWPEYDSPEYHAVRRHERRRRMVEWERRIAAQDAEWEAQRGRMDEQLGKLRAAQAEASRL